MKKILLRNPANGADILNANFVAIEDEKRNGDGDVINTKKYVFAKGTEQEVDEKTAIWALRTWKFLEKVKETEVKTVTETVITDFKEDKVLDPLEDTETPEIEAGELTEDTELSEDEVSQKMKDDFAELEGIGWPNLKGDQRDSYQLLKTQLEELN